MIQEVTQQFLALLKESDDIELGIFLAEAELGGEPKLLQAIEDEIVTRYPSFVRSSTREEGGSNDT